MPPATASQDGAARWRWEAVPACPVCGSPERRPFDKYVIDMDHGFVRCGSCDLLYLAPRPVYDETFVRDMYPDAEPAEVDFRSRTKDYLHNREFLDEIERLRPGKGSLLDVGCNMGDLLFAARERGWQVAGVDVSRGQVAYCRRKGLDVSREDITAPGPVARRFDVVTACHVLEHAPDPVAFLAALKERTADSGLLVIEVPNVMGWDLRAKRWLARKGLKRYKINTPHHLFEFTRAAFEGLAARVGLRVLSWRTYCHYKGRPHFLTRPYQAFLGRFKVGNKLRFFLAKRP
jgi:SAM-dependent methyltransferase